MTAVIAPSTSSAQSTARQRPVPRADRNRRKSAATGAWNALAMFVAAVLGFPIFWMLITSVKTSRDINRLVPEFWPHHFTWSAFTGVLSDPIFRDDLLNSLIITLATVLISIVIGFFGALAIARFRFAGRKVFIVAVLHRADDPADRVDDPDVAAARQRAAEEHPVRRDHRVPDVHDAVHGVDAAHLHREHPARAGRSRADRRLQPLAGVLQDHPAAGRARPDRHRRLRLGARVERVRARQHAAARQHASRR